MLQGLKDKPSPVIMPKAYHYAFWVCWNSFALGTLFLAVYAIVNLGVSPSPPQIPECWHYADQSPAMSADTCLRWANENNFLYPHDLTSEAVDKYLRMDERKNKTYNTMLSAFGGILKRLKIEPNAFLSLNPLSTTKGAKASEPKRAFTDDEIIRIFAHMATAKMKNRSEWIIAARIAEATGLRYKDIALLRWDSIRMDALGKYIELAPEKTQKATGGKVVYIRLTAKLAFVLDDLRQRVSGDYVLPALAAKYPTTKGPTAPFSRMLIAAGIENAGFHCFRVTIVTKAYKAGIDLEEFGGVVGHTTKAQTQAYNRAALTIDMEEVLKIRLTANDM